MQIEMTIISSVYSLSGVITGTSRSTDKVTVLRILFNSHTVESVVIYLAITTLVYTTVHSVFLSRLPKKVLQITLR